MCHLAFDFMAGYERPVYDERPVEMSLCALNCEEDGKWRVRRVL